MTETGVAEFITEFEGCRLPKARWTHQAHLIAGVWYASKYPAEQALPLSRESGWPLRYYTKERLFSVEARRSWVAPDRTGFI